VADNESMSLVQTPSREYFSEGEQRIPVAAHRSEKYFSPYVNNVQIGTSYYDISIHFNRVLEATKTGMLIEELVSVVMSPEHASDLYKALGEGLRIYQEKFGELRVCPKGPSSAK
jgi:hypothetical protein